MNRCKEKVESICSNITKETLIETLNNSLKVLYRDLMF